MTKPKQYDTDLLKQYARNPMTTPVAAHRAGLKVSPSAARQRTYALVEAGLVERVVFRGKTVTIIDGSAGRSAVLYTATRAGRRLVGA